MKERFEQIALKINQLPTEEQIFIRQLIDVLEREIDRKLIIRGASVKWCNKGKHFVLRTNFYPRKTGGLRSTCKECNRY